MTAKALSALLILLTLCCSNVSAAKRNQLSLQPVTTGSRVIHTTDHLLLRFSHPVDDSTLDGHIILKDSSGSLAGFYTLQLYPTDMNGKTVWLKFIDSFRLAESEQYFITIEKGLKYVIKTLKNGKQRYRRAKPDTISFITTSQSPFDTHHTVELIQNNLKQETARTKTIIISDIHIGDSRSIEKGYGWFVDNNAAFQSFLDYVRNSPQVKELVIAGDLFDEWIMPMDTQPFVDGITNDQQYFEAVALKDASVKQVIDKLNRIADEGNISLIYVPGNHDMLMTEAALKSIFPNAIWQGQTNDSGTIKGYGSYAPATGIIIEHGHIYDFFNAPDPYTREGSLLPPGYFVSRMYATNTMMKKKLPPQRTDIGGTLFFDAAWEITILAIFKNPLELLTLPDIITGINGYTESFSQNQARANYADNGIADNWQKRQQTNGVYEPETEFAAIITGSGIGNWGNLKKAAEKQFITPDRAKIVVFGHTHQAMLQKYETDNSTYPEAIYANSGTWVNSSEAGRHPTRTFVVVNPATATGNSIDTVSLYQYNINDVGEADLLLIDETHIGTKTANQ